MSDDLTYSGTASHGHAWTGQTFSDRDAAIEWAEGMRQEGWRVSLAIYGAVEGYEPWRVMEHDV